MTMPFDPQQLPEVMKALRGIAVPENDEGLSVRMELGMESKRNQ